MSKKIIGKLEIKRKYIYIYIYIDVKTDKHEYVKSIIYLYIFFYKKKINNNYLTNDVGMKWRNRSLVAINATAFSNI